MVGDRRAHHRSGCPRAPRADHAPPPGASPGGDSRSRDPRGRMGTRTVAPPHPAPPPPPPAPLHPIWWSEQLDRTPGHVLCHLVPVQFVRVGHGGAEEPAGVVIVHPHRTLVVDQPEIVIDRGSWQRSLGEVQAPELPTRQLRAPAMGRNVSRRSGSSRLGPQQPLSDTGPNSHLRQVSGQETLAWEKPARRPVSMSRFAYSSSAPQFEDQLRGRAVQGYRRQALWQRTRHACSPSSSSGRTSSQGAVRRDMSPAGRETLVPGPWCRGLGLWQRCHPTCRSRW